MSGAWDVQKNILNDQNLGKIMVVKKITVTVNIFWASS